MKVKVLIVFTLLLICNSIFAQEAQKIDEFEYRGCDNFLSRKDNFIIGLNENSNSKGYIFVYEGKLRLYDNNGKIYYALPHFGEAKEFISGMKTRFTKYSKFPLDRLIFVNGGFREKITIEFWLVPNGADMPRPTPTLKKMKYQKGKPLRFCGEF